jgi:hypothetical protein
MKSLTRRNADENANPADDQLYHIIQLSGHRAAEGRMGHRLLGRLGENLT